MHDEFLATLRDVASVHLVSRLQHPGLGFPGSKKLYWFIPDLHLLSNAAAWRYRYGTNHAGLLTAVVRRVAAWRQTLPADRRVNAVQLGDFLDLWRETPDPVGRRDAAMKIRSDHHELWTALIDDAEASCIVGNHDYELCFLTGWAGFERRLYLSPSGDRTSRVLVIHGDWFDVLERLIPQDLRQIIVNVFGPAVPPRRIDLGAGGTLPEELKAQMSAIHAEHRDRNYDDRIQLTSPAPLSAESPAECASPGWMCENVTIVGDDGSPLRFFSAAERTVDEVNVRYASQGYDVRLAVTGHSHHARIVLRERPDRGLFVLMDCGAWIEDCKLGDRTMPNAQLGVLCDNEIRIYQLEPR